MTVETQGSSNYANWFFNLQLEFLHIVLCSIILLLATVVVVFSQS